MDIRLLLSWIITVEIVSNIEVRFREENNFDVKRNDYVISYSKYIIESHVRRPPDSRPDIVQCLFVQYSMYYSTFYGLRTVYSYSRL